MGVSATRAAQQALEGRRGALALLPSVVFFWVLVRSGERDSQTREATGKEYGGREGVGRGADAEEGESRASRGGGERRLRAPPAALVARPRGASPRLLSRFNMHSTCVLLDHARATPSVAESWGKRAERPGTAEATGEDDGKNAAAVAWLFPARRGTRGTSDERIQQCWPPGVLTPRALANAETTEQPGSVGGWERVGVSPTDSSPMHRRGGASRSPRRATGASERERRERILAALRNKS